MPKHLRVKLATSTSVDVRQTSLAHFVANGAHYSQVDHTSGVVRFSPESKCCTSLVVRTIRVLSLTRTASPKQPRYQGQGGRAGAARALFACRAAGHAKGRTGSPVRY